MAHFMPLHLHYYYVFFLSSFFFLAFQIDSTWPDQRMSTISQIEQGREDGKGTPQWIGGEAKQAIDTFTFLVLISLSSWPMPWSSMTASQTTLGAQLKTSFLFVFFRNFRQPWKRHQFHQMNHVTEIRVRQPISFRKRGEKISKELSFGINGSA